MRNCNCIITSNQDNLNISNKHNSIIFYKDNEPVRLMVINKETNIDYCIKEALSQSFNNSTLRDIFSTIKIRRTEVNLNQPAVENNSDKQKEIDVLSCDRPSLLECMRKGNYTEGDMNFGKKNSDNSYNFNSNIFIQYKLTTDTEYFLIQHHCAFINKNMTRIIPLQDNSSLNIEMITMKNENN